MNKMRRTCAISLLTLMLSVSTFAGDIHTTIVNPPPPRQSDSNGTNGDIHIGVTGDESSDPVVEAALSLARAVLALF